MMGIAPRPQRLAVFVASAVIILVEIALMRELALRFWEHLAWLVISIALLGFGVSGTVLVLVHRFLRVSRQQLQYLSLLGLGLSLPACAWLADSIDINLIQMIWQPAMMWAVGGLEAALGIPFVFGGMFIGLALEDRPDRVSGHYAANFLGSGAGGLVALPLLYIVPPRLLILLGGCTVMLTALLFVRKKGQAMGWIFSTLLLAVMVLLVPHSPTISEEKDIMQLKAMTDSKTVARRYGPQGLIEIVEAPAYHTAPGLALNYSQSVPPQNLILIDGQVVGSLYGISSVQEYAFMDHTTLALPYYMGRFNHVLIGDESGSGQVELALFHDIGSITALTRNGQLADLLTREIATYSTNTYNSGNITLKVGTLREHLQRSAERHPLIVLPTVGTDPAGLAATEPDSRITLETLQLCFARLTTGGMLSVSTNIHLPPRESLRLLHLLIEILRESGREPADHIAMIRNWATVTLVAAKSPLTGPQLTGIRAFCQERGFDLVWLPDLHEVETNRFHRLEKRDDYYHGALSLLGPEPNLFIENYIYDLTIPDDNRPFFGHFSRLQSLHTLTAELGRYGRTYVEVGTVLLLAALGQALLLAATLIVLPLVPVVGLPGGRRERVAVLGFFSAVGLGFMLLEMGLLQRLTVYLAHPLWASATVITGFLVFGGIGSSISSLLRKRLAVTHLAVIVGVVVAGIALVLVAERFFAVTGGLELKGRIVAAYLLLAPLTLLMGMVFPLGMRRLGAVQPQFIPWAWSANGFTSVLATLFAPVMAMQWGFDLVAWSALGCYGLAALCSLRLPEGE